MVEKASDLIKDLVVLQFLGLEVTIGPTLSDFSATPLRVFVSAANPEAALRLKSWTIPRRRLRLPAVGRLPLRARGSGLWRGEPCP